MFNISEGVSFEVFLSSIEESTGKQIDLNSFDRDIFRAIYEYQNFYDSLMAKELNKRVFENMVGEELDDFLSFFGTRRLKSLNAAIYNFGFRSTTNSKFFIKKGCKVKYLGETYESIKDEYISKENVYVSFHKIPSTGVISSSCFTINGALEIDENFIETEGNKHKIISNELLLISYNIINDLIESDIEFRENSKSILQSYGFDNLTKIKSEITSLTDVKDIIVEEDELSIYITIIPNDINKCDEVLDYAKEIVDYNKHKEINVQKPNFLEILIHGVEDITYGISNEEEIINKIVSQTSSVLSLDSSTVNRSAIITAINNVLSNEYNLNYNDKTIVIKYNFYNRENYTSPVASGTIDGIKQISEDSVVSLGKIR